MLKIFFYQDGDAAVVPNTEQVLEHQRELIANGDKAVILGCISFGGESSELRDDPGFVAIEAVHLLQRELGGNTTIEKMASEIFRLGLICGREVVEREAHTKKEVAIVMHAIIPPLRRRDIIRTTEA